jgi:hypothetical protein
MGPLEQRPARPRGRHACHRRRCPRRASPSSKRHSQRRLTQRPPPKRQLPPRRPPTPQTKPWSSPQPMRTRRSPTRRWPPTTIQSSTKARSPLWPEAKDESTIGTDFSHRLPRRAVSFGRSPLPPRRVGVALAEAYVPGRISKPPGVKGPVEMALSICHTRAVRQGFRANQGHGIACRRYDARSGRGAAWLARLTGGQEVAGSNPVAPTRITTSRDEKVAPIVVQLGSIAARRKRAAPRL